MKAYSKDDLNGQAWEHKLNLDNRPLILSKWKYLRANQEIIEDYIFKSKFHSEEHGDFSLNSEIHNDKCLINRLWMDYDRERFFKAEKSVSKYGLPLDIGSKEEVTYNIKSLSSLRANLNLRLSNSVRKKDFLKAELIKVTTSINTICRTINDKPLVMNLLVKGLRESLETKCSYKFDFSKEYAPSDKAFILAIVWDIVRYEAYLKDKLARLDLTHPATDKIPQIKPKGLSARQRALLAVFQNKVVHRNGGDNNTYNHYNKLINTSDRTGYADETIRKAKHLISDYEAVIPLLAEDQKGRAEKEMVIIKAKRF